MITLNKAYSGYPAGFVVQLQTSTEAALVAQGLATFAPGGIPSSNAQTVRCDGQQQGQIAYPPGGSAFIIFNTLFTPESKVFAALNNNGSADTTAKSVGMIVPGNGQVTIILAAASTGVVTVDWVLLNPTGMTKNG